MDILQKPARTTSIKVRRQYLPHAVCNKCQYLHVPVPTLGNVQQVPVPTAFIGATAGLQAVGYQDVSYTSDDDEEDYFMEPEDDPSIRQS